MSVFWERGATSGAPRTPTTSRPRRSVSRARAPCTTWPGRPRRRSTRRGATGCSRPACRRRPVIDRFYFRSVYLPRAERRPVRDRDARGPRLRDRRAGRAAWARSSRCRRSSSICARRSSRGCARSSTRARSPRADYGLSTPASFRSSRRRVATSPLSSGARSSFASLDGHGSRSLEGSLSVRRQVDGMLSPVAGVRPALRVARAPRARRPRPPSSWDRSRSDRPAPAG